MSSSSINWHSPISALVKKKTKSIESLEHGGYTMLKDLLYIFPLKTQIVPPLQDFSKASVDQYFCGLGVVQGIQEKPNLRSKGKRGALLMNVTLNVQDHFSSRFIALKWFNCYPSQVKTLRKHKNIYFSGTISTYLESLQVANPDVKDIAEESLPTSPEEWSLPTDNTIKVNYPTVAGVSPHHLKGVMDKIPHQLWNNITENIPEDIIEDRGLFSLQHSFHILHGRCHPSELTSDNLKKAHQRLLYSELISNQIKLVARRERKFTEQACTINVPSNFLEKHQTLLPYELTQDQKTTVSDILSNFSQEHPMMRLIQGDVGCGKTTVAILCSLAVAEQGLQSAIMCPTETLAYQHYQSFTELLGARASVRLLTGSLKKSDKDEVLQDIATGKADIVIGTHALIQKDVTFASLSFIVIDEQHKFGVKQRHDLSSKGKGVHCAIMTATPIPRSLRLSQYGDLDISIIKTMPSNRKGTSTRIVDEASYEKYLSFLKTRISMGEQAYIVVPAVLENEEQDMLNLEVVLKRYKEYYPNLKIEGLHGQMKSSDKNDIFDHFTKGDIDLLISTSVIEVGVNNPNATVMAILSPERFGLSSLHQLRGRVGRGQKPGFCFLVNDRKLSMKALERLKVIENNTDGFIIADEDLRIRGEGDLFGKEQSGSKLSLLQVDIFQHPEYLEWATEDAMLLKDDYPQFFHSLVEQFTSDENVMKTL